MASTEHHRLQAEILNRLASSTYDPDTAASLRLLAARHMALADVLMRSRHEIQRKLTELGLSPVRGARTPT
jgi:hypothetical protein